MTNILSGFAEPAIYRLAQGLAKTADYIKLAEDGLYKSLVPVVCNAVDGNKTVCNITWYKRKTLVVLWDLLGGCHKNADMLLHAKNLADFQQWKYAKEVIRRSEEIKPITQTSATSRQFVRCNCPPFAIERYIDNNELKAFEVYGSESDLSPPQEATLRSLKAELTSSGKAITKSALPDKLVAKTQMLDEFYSAPLSSSWVSDAEAIRDIYGTVRVHQGNTGPGGGYLIGDSILGCDFADAEKRVIASNVQRFKPYRKAPDSLKIKPKNDFISLPLRHYGETQLDASCGDSSTDWYEYLYGTTTGRISSEGSYRQQLPKDSRPQDSIHPTVEDYYRLGQQLSEASNFQLINADIAFISSRKNIMSTKPVQVVTYVYGVNIEDMSDDQLIQAIKKAEAEKSKLLDIGTKSTKITKMVEDINSALDLMSKALDAKA